jgi:hypothetical protein
MNNEKPLPKPRPATVQRRIEKALAKDLDKVDMMALTVWYQADYIKGVVAPAPLLKRMDRIIRDLTKTRKALSASKKGRR